MIVFTMAYDEYAVRAFTVNSIDYLLKPVHKERLESAIQKFERFSGMGKGELNKLLGIEQLLHSFAERQEKPYRTRFLISGAKRFYTIQVGDIAYFYSLDKVTFAVTKDGKAHADRPAAEQAGRAAGRACLFPGEPPVYPLGRFHTQYSALLQRKGRGECMAGV